MGSGAAWGWALPSEAPSRALRCPVSPGWPGLDLQKGCVSYLKVRVALGKAGQEDQAVLLLSQQGWVLGGRHSPIPPAPFLCVDCLCYPHRSMAITSSSSSGKWGSLRPAPGCFSLALPFLRFRLRRPFPPPLFPSRQHFSSCASLVVGVSPFKVPCFYVPFQCAPRYHLSV